MNRREQDSGYTSPRSGRAEDESPPNSPPHVQEAHRQALTAYSQQQIRGSKPQGFRAGQLRRQGQFFCFRDCGRNFNSKVQEEDHYKYPDKCPNFPTTKRSNFQPSTLSHLKTASDRKACRDFTQALIRYHGKKNLEEGIPQLPASISPH